MRTNEITKQAKIEQEYTALRRRIADCKIPEDLDDIYLAYWKLSRLRPSNLFGKDKLREKLSEKMREVI
jgi:hypothetical protein